MNSPPKKIPFERYLAIDAHKRYVMVGGLNAQQEQVLLARKIEVKDYPKLAQAKLKPGDAVVIEATTNTWNLYDATVHTLRHSYGRSFGRLVTAS